MFICKFSQQQQIYFLTNSHTVFIFPGVLNMSTSAESPLRFSCHTLDKATKAKVMMIMTIRIVMMVLVVMMTMMVEIMKMVMMVVMMVMTQVTLENYYNNLISQHRERRDRLKRLEESLNDKGLSETVSRILLLLQTHSFQHQTKLLVALSPACTQRPQSWNFPGASREAESACDKGDRVPQVRVF